MKFPKYNFKKYWYRLLIFFLFDFFVGIVLLGMVYFLDNPDLLPTELLKIGPYEITYYDALLFMVVGIILNLFIGLIKSIWSMLFDWSIKGFRNDT